MAYTKQTWATGDLVTAEKLNNIESGVFDALPLVIHEDEQDGTLDVKANTISGKLNTGHFCVVVRNTDTGVVQDDIVAMSIDNGYQFTTTSGVVYTSATAGDYPRRYIQ